MSLSHLLEQLDPREHVRGDQFERISKWYLENAPEYRARLRRVWLWKEWPGAWGTDAGIDLVAEEHGGGLWAIQAKAYNPEYPIKKEDVDSFLSESSRPGFTYRLLIATTDRLGPTARRTLDAQQVPVGYLLRSQLELSNVEWPASPDDLAPRPPIPKQPKPHVAEAIDAVNSGFDGRDRGQLTMACGTGKTLGGMWITERLESRRTLVLLPSLSLLAQTLREWSTNASEPFDYLAVCSDETVGGGDQFVAHTAELAFPVTTDADEIAAFLRKRSPRVVFSTYQSSPQIAEAHRLGAPRFDLAIADEAHRCAGRVSSDFATILDAEKIKSRRRLFMTATPRVYTPRLRQEAGELDVEVASMDDEKVFGPVLHRLPFGEAIERGLLSDYQVVVVGVDDETYAEYAEQGLFVTPDEGKTVTDARSLAGQIALAKAMRKYGLRRLLSFHSRVAAARRFSREVPAVLDWLPESARPRGPLWSEHVSGAMSSGQRDRLLMRFRHLDEGERGLLSNARCLGEGVDVPTIDGVAFIDPRRSQIDIIQALGRAIRAAPDKKLGTVIIPVFIGGQDDPEQALDDSSFKHVWDVLKALRAHDEVLGEELDELRRGLGSKSSPPERPSKIKLEVPVERVGGQFAQAFDTRLVEEATASWEFWYGRLTRFVEREGHARVLHEYRDEGAFRLGAWVSKQRARGTRLSEERVRRLEALPDWTWAPKLDEWENAYSRLLWFVEREGHARVPADYRDDDGFRLGQWVHGQRNALRSKIGDDRARRLEALPGWSWDIGNARWEDGFSSLKQFIERQGHARVPPGRTDNDGFPLGQWVAVQRQFRKKGWLPTDRAQRLDSLPHWTWKPHEARWDEAFSRLKQFVQREGHARVPKDYRDDDDFALGSWVDRLRMVGRSKLSESRVQRLEALPEWEWKPYAGRWEGSFERLERFVAREGHARVPTDYRDDDGYSLGQWAQRQRAKATRPTGERARRLDALPGWTWDTREARWQDAFSRLRQFAQREGHSRIPATYQDHDGFPLGRFVVKQRARGRARLNEERAQLLEGLPDWTWDHLADRWEDAFSRLRRYAEREGHSRVPQTYSDDTGELGRWVSHQRRQGPGKLRDDQVRRLEALPGWAWDAREDEWEHAFLRLKTFVEREGHARVPKDYRDDDGFRLGQWVTLQRGSWKKGRLSASRTTRLEGLPGWTWEVLEAQWEDGFSRLKQYAEQEGHSRVPQQYVNQDGFRLGGWVRRQRAQGPARLSEERARRLDALPGWTWSTVSPSQPHVVDPPHQGPEPVWSPSQSRPLEE